MKIKSLALSVLVSALIGCGGGSESTGTSSPGTSNVVVPTGIAAVPVPDVLVEAGAAHTLALVEGNLWAWGRNQFGQVGNDDESGDNIESPTEIVLKLDEGVSVVSIKSSDNYNLLLDSTGDIWAWGRNTYGQMANGTTDSVYAPAKIAAFDDIEIVAVATGTSHALALDNTGQVWSWGQDSNGSLGREVDSENPLAPALVMLAEEIEAIAAGSRFSLAVNTSGQVYGWGENTHSQLGQDSDLVSSVDTPTLIVGLENVTNVAAGLDHSLFLHEDKTISTLGKNTSGQLGDSTDVDESFIPVKASVIVGESKIDVAFTAIDAEGHMSMATADTGVLYTWGQNLFGSLMQGLAENSFSPRPISNLVGNAKQAACGAAHTIVADQDEQNLYRIWTAGLNANGQRGVPGLGNSTLSPVEVTIPLSN